MNAMTNPAKLPGSKGFLAFSLGWRGAWAPMVMHGGPYNNFERTSTRDFGVCVRRESLRGLDYDVHLPIDDFSVPKNPADLDEALIETIDAILHGKQVWIGCMGGMGRTGLFMALVCKAAGVPNPVEFVRENYFSHAVETAEQYSFVEAYDVSNITKAMYKKAWQLGWRKAFFRWKNA
jgi:hypothetical protein